MCSPLFFCAPALPCPAATAAGPVPGGGRQSREQGRAGQRCWAYGLQDMEFKCWSSGLRFGELVGAGLGA